MAAYSKLQVLQTIQATGVVPVFNTGDVKTAKCVLKAAYDGGIRAFEFTNRGDGAIEVFAELVKYAKAELPGMIVGAGTVSDPGTAALYLQYGANFIVGPVLNPEVAPVCNRRLVPYCPGCGTVSEVNNAQELGCDLVKVFPGDVLKPAFVKALRGPMPWSQVMVTGMVELTRESLESWFGAGVFCVGMGTALFPKDSVAAGDWEEITRRCKAATDLIKGIKS